jgi:hypothetical protein
VANAQVGQSAVEIVLNGQPDAQVFQNFVEIVLLPGTPVPPPQTMSVGSGKHPPLCKPLNWFNACALAEELRMRSIQFPPLCAIPPEYCNLLPWEDDAAIPHEAVPFNPTLGITTPAPAAGDQTVVSLRVPYGYDGLLTGIWWLYSGINFVQGSGDIIWRVQVNQRYVKDLSNVLFQLGNPKTPIPLTEGVILFSGQTVRIVVNVPNLSGQIQVGASTISAGLLGFYWPR